jgi:hypothetical protein
MASYFCSSNYNWIVLVSDETSFIKGLFRTLFKASSHTTEMHVHYLYTQRARAALW